MLGAGRAFAEQLFKACLSIANRLAVQLEHVAQLDVAIRVGRP